MLIHIWETRSNEVNQRKFTVGATAGFYRTINMFITIMNLIEWRMWFPQLIIPMESFLMEHFIRNLKCCLEKFMLELRLFHGIGVWGQLL